MPAKAGVTNYFSTACQANASTSKKAPNRSGSFQRNDIPQGTAHRRSTALNHMRIDLGRAYILVAQLLLYCPDILPPLKQVGCEGVAQGMTACLFMDTRSPDCTCDCLSNATLIQMVTAFCTRAWIYTALTGRKQVLPFPFAVCIWILFSQSMRQIDSTEPLSEITFMLCTHNFQMPSQRRNQLISQCHHPILAPLTVTYIDSAMLEIEIHYT